MLTSFSISGCNDVNLLHPILFINMLAAIDEILPPSFRFFLCITTVGLAVGGFFFISLCSLKMRRKKELEKFKQREDDIFTYGYKGLCLEK